MRLLNTKSLKPHDFFDSTIPGYAILSHRWGEDEVSYQDLLGWGKRRGAGYSKIRNCCAKALSDGFEWVWIDTCCIDKKSSAELSEAINAMFRWYQASDICYAFLSDVEAVVGKDGRSRWPYLKDSVWFTRGWTLQELLAPSRVVFLDSAWAEIEMTDELKMDIEAATGIPQMAYVDLGRYSVAQRMSWAAKRETSRVEDQAYCLLGIFGVVMPLLYGEGEQAFARLQQEIIRTSDDESIFVWSIENYQAEARALRSVRRQFLDGTKKSTHAANVASTCTGKLLAPRLSCFKSSGAVQRNLFFWRPPYSLTNKGLRINAILCPDSNSVDPDCQITPLNCSLDGEETRPLVLQLTNVYDHIWWARTGWTKFSGDFKSLFSESDKGEKEEIYIAAQEPSSPIRNFPPNN